MRGNNGEKRLAYLTNTVQMDGVLEDIAFLNEWEQDSIKAWRRTVAEDNITDIVMYIDSTGFRGWDRIGNIILEDLNLVDVTGTEFTTKMLSLKYIEENHPEAFI